MLAKLKGEDVPSAIATALEGSKKGPLRDLLIRVAASQPAKETIHQLMKLAGDDLDPATRTLALASIKTACTPTEIVPLLSLAIKFQEEPLRTDYYKTVEALLAKETDRDRRVQALAPALKTAGPSSQNAIYRLIGATGSPASHSVLAGEISAAGDRRRAALESLKSWNAPNLQIADALFDALKIGDHDTYTGPAALTYSRVPTLTAAEVVASLRKLLPFADSPRSRSDFAAALATLGSKEALDFANELADGADLQLAAAVKQELEKLTKQQATAVTLAKGDNILDASTAVILSTEPGDAQFSAAVRHITGWRSGKSRIAWDIIVPDSMTAEIEIVQSGVRPGNSFFVTIAGTSIETDVAQTKTSDDFMRVNAGKFELFRKGAWRIFIEPGRMAEKETLMNIRSITVRVK